MIHGFKIVLFSSLLLAVCCQQQPAQPATADKGKGPAIGIQHHIPAPNPYASIDVSPMDMSYYPDNYPQKKIAEKVTGKPVMRVIYSRPHLEGRSIFKDILRYGQTWRLGANEATELDVYQPVYVDGKKLNEGRYTLYCIPQEDKWTIAVNSNLDIWGLRTDSTLDVLRTHIPATHRNPRLEYFTMVFEKTNTGATLIMGWDDVLAKLPFTF